MDDGWKITRVFETEEEYQNYREEENIRLRKKFKEQALKINEEPLQQHAKKLMEADNRYVSLNKDELYLTQAAKMIPYILETEMNIVWELDEKSPGLQLEILLNLPSISEEEATEELLQTTTLEELTEILLDNMEYQGFE